MKPIMPSAILRDSSASFARNNPAISDNRYSVLRNNPDSRARSPSVKRKAMDNAYANAAKKSLVSRKLDTGKTSIVVTPPPQLPVISAENIEIFEINSAKIASICEKLHKSILAIPEENRVCPILRDLCAIVHTQSENSKIVIDALHKAVMPVTLDTQVAASVSGTSDSEMDGESDSSSQMVSLGRLPRARNSLLPSDARGRAPRAWGPASGPHPAPRTDSSPPPAVTPELQRFRDLVSNAERSTLIFNLDMGRVPIINKNTMCMKATSAITAMAAIAEDRPANNPSRDTFDAIDNALSVADNVSFFGNSTKSVKGKGADSGSFCTIPVCYSFPDKDTRIKAEQVLRSRCKVSCSTPYPQALRACIKQVLESGSPASG